MPVMTHMNSSSDVMRPEEGNDSSLDTFIRDAIGRQPLLSFSRPNDKPVQWIQLLNALDQPGTRLCLNELLVKKIASSFGWFLG